MTVSEWVYVWQKFFYSDLLSTAPSLLPIVSWVRPCGRIQCVQIYWSNYKKCIRKIISTITCSSPRLSKDIWTSTSQWQSKSGLLCGLPSSTFLKLVPLGLTRFFLNVTMPAWTAMTSWPRSATISPSSSRAMTSVSRICKTICTTFWIYWWWTKIS